MQDTTTLGERIQEARKQRRMSQETLAERAGISASFLAKIERGTRTPGVMTLFRLAAELDADTSWLLDRRDRLESGGRQRGIQAVRDALLAPGDLPGLDLGDDGPAVPLPDLERAVRTGWHLYWTGQLAGLAALLPSLLSSARATERETGTAACRPLAQSYQLAADLMVHVGNDDLAFAGAMRAMRTAVRGDDPLQEATLAGTASWVLLHQNRLGLAEQVAAKAAGGIRPSGKAPMAHYNVFGALLLSAAAPAAARGDADAVDGYMGEASVVALQYAHGDRHDYQVSFGRSQLEMQRAHQCAVLGKPDAALKAAGKAARSDLLAISWGALHLDVAQAALEMRGKARVAVNALLTAYSVSPEWAKHQGLWRDAAVSAVRADRSGAARKLEEAAGLGLCRPPAYAGRLTV
jgi:DNA-binding XRE family transcriptional regulator